MPSGQFVNRTNIDLPKEVASEILTKTIAESAIMTLAPRINLPGRGQIIPVISSDPVAEWVDETGVKPVSQPGLTTKTMTPHVLAVIIPFSNQFRRDIPSLYNEIVARVPRALGFKIDQTVFGGSSMAGFDVLSGATAVSLQSDVYGGLVAADVGINTAGGLNSGYVFSPQGRGVLLNATDGEDRPLLLNSLSDGALDRILGAPVHYTPAAWKEGASASGDDPAVPDVIGIAGDWSHSRFGIVQGVQARISEEATLTYTNQSAQTVTINLFQQDMFAVRFEIECGFIAETDYFRRLTKTHS